MESLRELISERERKCTIVCQGFHSAILIRIINLYFDIIEIK